MPEFKVTDKVRVKDGKGEVFTVAAVLPPDDNGMEYVLKSDSYGYCLASRNLLELVPETFEVGSTYEASNHAIFQVVGRSGRHVIGWLTTSLETRGFATTDTYRNNYKKLT